MGYRSDEQLRQNLKHLLLTRRVNQKDLAAAMGRHPTTLNKFLQGTRELQCADLDKIADFFGMQVYELFQPGGNRLTDRRTGHDRRAGKERRVGPAHRMMRSLAVDVTKLWQNSQAGHAVVEPPSIAAQAKLEALVAEFEQRAAPILAARDTEPRGQAPGDRPPVTRPSKTVPPARRPDHRKT